MKEQSLQANKEYEKEFWKDTKVSSIRSDERETIIAAAVRVENYGIFIWKRHHNCLKKIADKWVDKLLLNKSEQWFMTSEHRFVDRYVGMDIALEAWQPLLGRWDYASWQPLFSEDLR